MLSDVGSVTMRELGVVDVDIEQHQAHYGLAFKERHKGVPYASNFVLDAEGRVTSKEVEPGFRTRSSGEAILARVGGVSSADHAHVAQARGIGMTITASVEAAGYRPMQRNLLHLQLSPEPGFHVYVEPVPSGFTPLQVRLMESPLLAELPWEVPPGEPFAIDGLDEEFFVAEDLELDVPFIASGARHTVEGKNREDPLEDGLAVVTVEVTYQVCSATECLPPAVCHVAIPLRELPPLD